MKRAVASAWVMRCLAWLLLGGCCLSGGGPESLPEMEGRTYDHPYDLVFAAVRSVLETRGHPISQEDREKGLLVGDWLEGKYERRQVSAQVRPLGRRTTEVLLLIEKGEKGVLSNTWKPVEVKYSEYDRLFEEIDLQIYREYFHKIERPAREGTPLKDQ